MSKSPSMKRRRWPLACGGCVGLLAVGCCGIFAAAALAPRFRPTARDVYSAAPDLQASADVSEALIDSGMQGASVLVIPIKGSSGQIAIITLDESKGYVASSAGGADNMKTVVSNIVAANLEGNYNIERLSIDYRDTTGESSLAFTATMESALAYANGNITQQEFMGNTEVNLTDSLLYFGIDPQLLLQEGGQP